MSTLVIFERIELMPESFWRWGPEFSPNEFRCRGTGELRIDEDFMDALLALRRACDFPFIITSAGRNPTYNDIVSNTGLTGPHTEMAVDIAISGERAFILLSKAASYGFTGIGVKQKGPHGKRFIHLDKLMTGSRPWVWSY